MGPTCSSGGFGAKYENCGFPQCPVWSQGVCGQEGIYLLPAPAPFATVRCCGFAGYSSYFDSWPLRDMCAVTAPFGIANQVRPGASPAHSRALRKPSLGPRSDQEEARTLEEHVTESGETRLTRLFTV